MAGKHFLDELGRFDGDAEILQAWRDGMMPEPALLVSEWADRHRMLGSRDSAEPGPYRTARTPYLKEVMDALSPSHPARRVVFMKGAQVGATTCGSNWIGYVIHHAPGPMLAVQPTTELAKRFSDQRIDPLVEETPAIRERVAPARSRDSGNRQLSKEFPGGQLVMTGANSAVGLRSMSARFLFLDEIDAYPGDVEGEGDPIALAEARARTFGWRRKMLLVSTPTIAGLSRIEREYLATDQRRYFVPCPHCGHRQHLRFERLVWDEGEPETARYLCEACDAPIGEQHKAQMLAAGEWRATATATDPHAVGFHVSALYSPPGWMTWAEIARLWLAAQGDDRAIKTFRNTVLGETWQEAGEAPDWQRLYDRREHWPAGTVPMGGLLLTAGVDVQRDRLEASVWAWGEDRQSWLVEHRVLAGNPFEAQVWEELVMRAVVESGECFVRFLLAPPSPANPIGLRLQVLESDHLDTARNGVVDGAPTLQGIALGEAGEPIGYWLHRVHPGASWILPGATWLSSERIPAGDVLHVYRKRRPGQLRDVSWLAPVLLRLRDLGDYEAALLMKAKIEACLAAVVTEEGDEALTGAASGLLRDAQGRAVESFEPGMILYRRGMGSVEVVNPSGGGSHAAFARRALEAAAVGAGLTYDQVSGDLTQANYSSLRAGKIEFRRLCEQVQYGMLIPMLVRPVADRFHAQGALLGLWGAEMPDGVSHVPPAHEMIDPLKDTTALIAQVRAGFVPQPEAAGAFGYDFRAAVEMIREANALLDEAGISLDTDPRRVAKSGAAQDAAQMAAVEIAATGAAAPPREIPAQG